MARDDDPVESDPPDEPIAVLRDLEIEPTGDLPVRVRRTIERRFLGRDLVGFYWAAVAELVTEWLSVAFGRAAQGRRSERGER